MAQTIATRAEDERLLDALRLRAEGVAPREIADLHKTTRDAVMGATRRVLVADLAQSGEPEDVVRAGYWA